MEAKEAKPLPMASIFVAKMQRNLKFIKSFSLIFRGFTLMLRGIIPILYLHLAHKKGHALAFLEQRHGFFVTGIVFTGNSRNT
ncbi:MAG: hypothetical protein IKH88_08210 [Prevotella sp.]|nr:hypothetical protein [Prevotella sp.]